MCAHGTFLIWMLFHGLTKFGDALEPHLYFAVALSGADSHWSQSACTLSLSTVLRIEFSSPFESLSSTEARPWIVLTLHRCLATPCVSVLCLPTGRLGSIKWLWILKHRSYWPAGLDCESDSCSLGDQSPSSTFTLRQTITLPLFRLWLLLPPSGLFMLVKPGIFAIYLMIVTA